MTKLKIFIFFHPPPVCICYKFFVTLHIFFALANVCLKKGKKNYYKMTQPLHTISSTANIQVFGATGPASATPSTGGWNSLSTTKTASFSTIQKEVIQTVTYSPGHTYKAYNPVEEATQALYTEQPQGPRRSSSRPGVPTGGNGETPPATGQLVPIGDMLLPMLVIALGYIIVKLFRNRKTSQAL
jgi:hypothetical protein